jgi:hypothetical protein
MGRGKIISKKSVWAIIISIVVVIVIAVVIVIINSDPYNEKDNEDELKKLFFTVDDTSSNENNIITISRIDGESYLNMPYTYANNLLQSYSTYGKYINDISISTDITDITNTDIHIGISGSTLLMGTPSYLITEMKYIQGITSIKEIIKQKDDCEIRFYGDYTEKDLVSPLESDDCSGYVIIPAAVGDYLTEGNNDGTGKLDLTNRLQGQSSELTLNFFIIGEYVTKDDYDTLFFSYSGYNEKFMYERYRDDISSIVIETKKDVDITPFITYLEKYFADADDLEKFEGTVNSLDVEYEFCYDRTQGTE